MNRLFTYTGTLFTGADTEADTGGTQAPPSAKTTYKYQWTFGSATALAPSLQPINLDLIYT